MRTHNKNRLEGVEWTLGEPDGIQIKTVSDWVLTDDDGWQIENWWLTSYENFNDYCLDIVAPNGIEAALFRMRDEIIQQALDWRDEDIAYNNGGAEFM